MRGATGNTWGASAVWLARRGTFSSFFFFFLKTPPPPEISPFPPPAPLPTPRRPPGGGGSFRLPPDRPARAAPPLGARAPRPHLLRRVRRGRRRRSARPQRTTALGRD